MIPPSSTFEYEAEFTPASFRDRDIDLTGASQSPENVERLVGHNPKIRFWNERLVLVASDKHNASARNTSVPIGDAVNLSARPGDRLYVVRTGAGGFGLSVLREERLVLAIGVVTAVPLGRQVRVTSGAKGLYGWADQLKFTWLDLSVGGEQMRLEERKLIDAEGYQIYVEHFWRHGMPGTDECVSVCVADDPALKIAAVRSAVLLANGDVQITKWDGGELFTQFST